MVTQFGLGAALGLGGNLIGSLIAGGIGRKQQNEGSRMIAEAQRLSESYQRPEMSTPEAITQMVNMARGQMYQRLPGADMYANQIGGTTAAGLSAIQGMGAGSEGIGALAGLYGGQMSALQGLAGQEANFRAQGQQNYMSALQGLGDYQQQNWQWNQADPYLQAQQKAAMLDAYGRMNQMEGYINRAGVWAEAAKGFGETGGDAISEILKLFKKG
jgi:hypothetical protein